MLPTFQSWTVRKMIECLTQGLLSSHWNIYHGTTAYFFWATLYISGNVIFATVALVCINVQPKHELVQGYCSIYFILAHTTRSIGSLLPLHIIYWVTSYLRLLALSILTCSPNTSFLARLVTDNSRSLKHFSCGHCPSQLNLRKICCTKYEFLLIATCMSDLIFVASLTSDILTILSNWGPTTLIRGHLKPRGSNAASLDWILWLWFPTSH